MKIVRITQRSLIIISLMILLAILFSYQNTDQNWTAAGENLTSDENLFQEEKDGKDGSDKFSNDQELNYSGIYYLHDDLPEHGQDIGNTHDVGDLLRVEPHGKEERYCAKWVQFDFDEHVFGEITGDESYYIENIYYHIWWKSANEKARIGVDIHGYYDSHTDYSFQTSHQKTVSTIEKNGYWLSTGMQNIDCTVIDIHDLTVKVASIDAIPSVYSGIDQYSFIILNLEDDDTLKSNDRDKDGLSDHEELFTYFTNPEDKDTDNDGLLDPEEVIEGDDKHITDPNNFDIDNDDLVDGEDTNPTSTQYRVIDKKWQVTGEETIKNDGLLVNNDIIVKKGGSLTIDNTILKMNQEGQQYSIQVEAGGELNILNSHLVTDDPDHWYSMTLDTEHWHAHRTFEIYGSATLQNNIIDYGGMIYIKFNNDTIIEDNTISHYYYGIFCSYSSPKIDNNKIYPFIGNGIFLWHSSPQITNSIIRTYIGTGISCYYSAPIIKSCEINGGSNDFYLSGDSHPIVSNTIFNNSMVHIDDNNSSLLVGTFNSDKPQENEDNKDGSEFSNIYLELGLIVLLIVGLIFACFFIKEKFGDNKFEIEKDRGVKKSKKRNGKSNRRNRSNRNKRNNRSNRSRRSKNKKSRGKRSKRNI